MMDDERGVQDNGGIVGWSKLARKKRRKVQCDSDRSLQYKLQDTTHTNRQAHTHTSGAGRKKESAEGAMR